MLVYVAGYKINGARLELGVRLLFLGPLPKLHSVQQCSKFDVVSASSVSSSKLMKPDELKPFLGRWVRHSFPGLHWDGRRAVESTVNSRVTLRNGVGEKAAWLLSLMESISGRQLSGAA